jgi:hypothetical protein
LFLPSTSNAEPSIAALSEIYVTQEFGTETMPKDEEEAGRGPCREVEMCFFVEPTRMVIFSWVYMYIMVIDKQKW